MRKCYSISDISTLSDRQIFFDANILIYLFWPTGSQEWESKYSSIFGKLLKQNNKMVVDFIVISEVVNRAIRSEYQNFLDSNSLTIRDLPYKKYRDSNDGQEALKDIYLILQKNVIDKFDIADKSFDKKEIEKLLHIDNLDFSDKAIVEICKEQGFVLLTNDKDFAKSDLEILSSHPALVRYHA